MKINRQLFEDVLSGKLKGTFVLRNGYKCDSSFLQQYDNRLDRSYSIGVNSYYSNGLSHIGDLHKYDIIDFIPEKDMKENELTIEIPNGKEIDWDESKKQNKIVLKDKQLTYKEICNRLPGTVNIPLLGAPSKCDNILVADEHQLECILAKNKLATVAKYLNDGWKSDKGSEMYHINNSHGNLTVYLYKEEWNMNSGQFIFKTKELAQQAIEILGEETVKLALEPLGI